MTTMTTLPSPDPVTPYVLAVEAGEWLQTIATAGGIPPALALLDAAWHAGILTGPYRPALVLQADQRHRLALDAGHLHVCTPPYPPARFDTTDTHHTDTHHTDTDAVDEEDDIDTALAFLRDVTDRATHLLQTWTRYTSTSPGYRPTDPTSRSSPTEPVGPGGDGDDLRFNRISRAYYGGVGAGIAGRKGADALRDVDHEVRVAYFWLIVGGRMHVLLPEAHPREHEAFIQGAVLREPEPETPVLQVTIDQPPLAPETGKWDEGAWFGELADALARVAREVRGGAVSGQVTSGDRTAIGTFLVGAPE